jgi:hypothetical protein
MKPWEIELDQGLPLGEKGVGGCEGTARNQIINKRKSALETAEPG